MPEEKFTSSDYQPPSGRQLKPLYGDLPHKDGYITGYHGTGRYFQGPPTKARKDVLGLGTLSLSPYRDFAEFFAGPSVDGRVFAVRLPVSKVLDMDDELAPLFADWDKNRPEIQRRIQRVKDEGKYDAILLHDITFGDENAKEIRVLHPSTMASRHWYVGPSEEYREFHLPFERDIASISAGKPLPVKRLRELREYAENIGEDAGLGDDYTDAERQVLQRRAADMRRLYARADQAIELKKRRPRRSEFRVSKGRF